VSTHALVTVKLRGKSRLSSVLGAADRERLVLAMLQDVLGAVAAVRGLDGATLLAPAVDWHTLGAQPSVRGFERMSDAGLGRNAAVAAAARDLEARGISRLLVLSADLPCATSREIEMLLAAAGAARSLTIAVNEAGEGSNALVLTPPALIAPSFGRGSRALHEAAANQAGARVRCVSCAGLARDIDVPADLEHLLRARPDRYAFLPKRLREAS
jgi:2-phospho-L-lactate guanylyltransferase